MKLNKLHCGSAGLHVSACITTLCCLLSGEGKIKVFSSSPNLIKMHAKLTTIKIVETSNSKACKRRHDSDKTQINKPEWRTIFLKQFVKQPVFLEHIFETKTLPRFPLVFSDRADVV